MLSDWQLSYFDLLLIHFPVALECVPIETRYPSGWESSDGKTVKLEQVPLAQTWKYLEDAVAAGFAKDIGYVSTQSIAFKDI